MPSGKTHDIFNVVVLIIGVVIVVTYSGLAETLDEDVFKNCMLLFLCSYIFSTFFLSPDLDLKKNRSKLNWGFIRFIWWPYSKICKHRGISHSIVFGILTRLIYIYGIYFIGLMIYFIFGDIDFEDLPFLFIDTDDFELPYAVALLAGAYFPSIFHTALDKLVTKEKLKSNKASKPLKATPKKKDIKKEKLKK